ncbi:amidohydrolase family protein, partial [Fusobacterium mortiferum]
MKKAIINGELFIGNKFYKEKVLIFEDDKIVDILDEETFKKDGAKIETIDANGSYVTPGFIDLQLNGCGGVLFNDDISKETIETMYKTNLKSGCTSFTPTL